jgi:hypothetical protein
MIYYYNIVYKVNLNKWQISKLGYFGLLFIQYENMKYGDDLYEVM